MEQQQQTPDNPSAERRRARMLRELESFGMDLSLLGDLLKYGAAMAVGALLTLWITSNTSAAFVSPVGQLQPTPQAARAGAQQGAAPAGIADQKHADKQATTQTDTPQRDVHNDSAFPARP